MSVKLNEKLLESLQVAIQQQNNRFIQETLKDKHAADISVLLDQMDALESKYILRLLNPEMSADIVADLEEDTRKGFLKNFSSEELAGLMDYTDSDDAADILNDQPVKVREEVIALMQNSEKAEYIIDLLHYEEDCAGGLMAKELIKANINWNIKQCIEEIRRQTKNVEKVYTVYVVNDKDTLLGRVSLKKIVLSTDDTKIKDIYVSNIQTVQTYYSEEEVAEIMRKYDLEVVPVVNVQGKLLGRITIDDVVDVITEQAELERQIMSGLSETAEVDDSIWTLSRARLPWLIIGMMGGLLGAQYMGFFENELKIVPAIAFFVPLIQATGGNVGIQSSTIVVQTLVGNPFDGKSLGSRLFKVLLVAIFNGIVISSLVFGFVMIFNEMNMAFVVAVALFNVVLIASLTGTITPLILDRLGVNPALASGPFITTANDLIGLAVYFTVAKLLFSI
ncbi:magnesium transporter [Rapidithrix thailandica]|uniref:Magnesium transporter MgtE n=1 Tax=Rapidithrix thailandica TaxID=413964 RepID=A0AAW9RZZ1_9BACT